MNGLEIMMKSLGFNPQAITSQVQTAVKAITDRFDALEKRLDNIETILKGNQNVGHD